MTKFMIEVIILFESFPVFLRDVIGFCYPLKFQYWLSVFGFTPSLDLFLISFYYSAL